VSPGAHRYRLWGEEAIQGAKFGRANGDSGGERHKPPERENPLSGEIWKAPLRFFDLFSDLKCMILLPQEICGNTGFPPCPEANFFTPGQESPRRAGYFNSKTNGLSLPPDTSAVSPDFSGVA
jgi:hypothetical protein